MDGKEKVGDLMGPEDSQRCISAEKAIHHLMGMVQEDTGSSAVGMTALLRVLGWALVHLYETDEEAAAHVSHVLPMVLRDMRAEKEGQNAVQQH